MIPQYADHHFHTDVTIADQSMNDADIFICDPDDPAFQESFDQRPVGDVLTLLAARCAESLSRRPDALRLLTDAGITDAATIAAFGIGAGTHPLLDDLTDHQRQQMTTAGLLRRSVSVLTGPGFIIPTRDPRDYATVLGFVKVSPGQLKHGHVGAVAGIACAADVVDAPKIIIADHPLLALRLYQAGVKAVVLVEEMAVIPPLLPWLFGRHMTLVSYKKAGLAAMRAAFSERAGIIPGVVMAMAANCFSADVRATLGMEVAAPRAPAAPISLRLLADLHAYAVRQLDTSAGLAALASVGIADRAILDAYRVGFLPANFRDALTLTDRYTLQERRWADALVFPAFDANGVVVDVVVAQTADGGHVDQSVWDSPRGMLAPTLATAFSRLTITDVHRGLGALFQSDVPALLVRGVDDAQQQAAQLIASGVTHVDVHVRRNRAEYQAALCAAGFVVDGKHEIKAASTKPLQFPPVSVEAVATENASPVAVIEDIAESPPALEFVSHDVQREQASFQYKTALYDITGIGRDSTLGNVTLIMGDQRYPQNQLDIAVPDKRARFARAIPERAGVVRSDVETALRLIAETLPTLRKTQTPSQVHHAKSSSTKVVLSSSERAAALARLRDQNVLSTICETFEAMGWLGDADAKALAVLGSISRLTDEPLWLAFVAADDGERFLPLRCLAAITPTDSVVHVSRLTDAALFHAAPDAFRHRLLMLDDLNAISPAAITALRVLHAHGSLSGSTVERDVLSGGMRTNFHVVHGPLALVAAAPKGIPESLARQVLPLPLEASTDVIEKQLAAKRRAFAQPQAATTSDLSAHPLAIAWRQAFSLLEAFPVVIPESELVTLPAIVGQNRVFSDAAFTLIATSAVLHQHQRLRTGGSLIATPADIALGVRLATHVAASRASDLSSSARQLLTRLGAAGLKTFTMDDLAALLPEGSRWTHRAAVDELTRFDYIDAGRGGRGRMREYRLVATRTRDSAAHVGGLAAVGGDVPPTVKAWSQTC